jgi:hypothetical protein
MHNVSRRVLISTGSLALSLAVPGAAHADRVIDAFSDLLPNTTLPGTSTPAPLLWAGKFSGVTQLQASASQSNLPGVIGGQRVTTVREPTLSNLVTATMTQSGGRYELGYDTGTGHSGVLTLEYGAVTPLNLNLSTDGSLAFELDMVGDMDDSASLRPVQLTISAKTGTGSLVSRTFSLAHDGVYQFPFSSFSGVNFADVDYLKFTFDASAVSAVDYSLIGGLRTTGCLQTTGTVIPDLFIDTFRTALPPRTLPGSGSFPIMWAGTLNGVTKPIDVAAQSGIAGTIGGQRTTTIEASAIQNFLTGSMSSVGATPAFSYATGNPTSGRLTFEYGAQTSLNANLGAMKAFELELSGDLASGASPRPVPLTVTVVSGTGSASTQVTLLNNGTYYIPFQAFPGVNFSDVDYLQFHFDASGVQAVDYTLIGGLRASACTR